MTALNQCRDLTAQARAKREQAERTTDALRRHDLLCQALGLLEAANSALWQSSFFVPMHPYSGTRKTRTSDHASPL